MNVMYLLMFLSQGSKNLAVQISKAANKSKSISLATYLICDPYMQGRTDF